VAAIEPFRPWPSAKADAKGGQGHRFKYRWPGGVVNRWSREYAAFSGAARLVFGRDATCDVVVPGKDVSCGVTQRSCRPRKGYLSSIPRIHDVASTIAHRRPAALARADVITEFRGERKTSGCIAPIPRRRLQKPSTGGSAPLAPAALVSYPDQAARASRNGPRVPGAPAAPAASRPSGGVLASFPGPRRLAQGQRLTIKTPVVNSPPRRLQRLVFPDESSQTQAKLQRREG